MTKLSKRKVALRFKGVIATANFFPEEVLKHAAEMLAGLPVTYGHRGRLIGHIEQGWYEDGKLCVRGVVYEPKNEDEKIFLDSIKSGEVKAVSPSFLYKPVVDIKKSVLHGSITEWWEEEDKFHIRVKIPKEEIIKKIGSLKNLQRVKFNRIILHDGSEKSKEEAEKRLLEEK